jgi:hypothetical protein
MMRRMKRLVAEHRSRRRGTRGDSPIAWRGTRSDTTAAPEGHPKIARRFSAG